MKLIWVHADGLHPLSPAYVAYPDAPSIFVWEDAELQRTGWTMKRVAFVYECLLDLPLTIRRGDPVLEVRRFMEEMQCSEVVTVATPDPHLQSQAKSLNAEILEWQPFVKVAGKLDLRRFSRYWSKVESLLLP